MLIIGLTGPSGSGKTTLCKLVCNEKIHSINADEVYHSLLVPPSDCLDEIVSAFGASVLNTDKTLDRKALSAIVFGDGSGEKLSRLNSISHKYVKDEFRVILANKKAEGVCAVIIDAPTLFESGFDKECDITVSLLADRRVRGERIIARDDLTPERAEARISAQHTDDFFIKNSDHIIYNNGQTSELRKAFMDMIEAHGGLNEK